MIKRNNTSDHPDIMVSSTYSDLVKHREAVVEALVRLGFFPVGMEFDSAKAGKDIIASSLEMVGKADAYIGLLSHRYGGVPKDTVRNPDELSITELEYREALERGIPVFMFLMSDDHPVKRQDVESVEAYQTKLKRLKDDARSRSIYAEFSSVGELEARVLQSMAEHRAQLAQAAHEEEPAQDQPRSRQATEMPSPPRLLAIPSFISGHQFVGRRMELAWLDEWATSHEALLIVEAIGGAGKSTLAWQWLTERSTAIRPDLAGAMWYSFYEGGADTAAFAAYALAYITGRPLKEFRTRKTAELTVLLVAALRTRPFLLVLDGLERVLVAYHRLDASQARDDQVDSERRDRACTKLPDDDLLRQLVAVGASKILITSRLIPTALTNRTGQLLPGVRHHNLRGLHPDDALALMRSAGVYGDEAAIRRYLAENFDNHPLLVGIVAGLVNEYFREPGNFDRWVDDPQGGAALHLSKLDLSQRRTHILAAALRGLEPGTRQLLSRIAALGEAVPFETVAALNPFLPPPPEAPEDYELYNTQAYLEELQSRLKQESSTKRRREIAKEIRELQAHIEALKAQSLAVEEYSASDEVRQALPNLIAGLKDLEQRGLLQWDRKKNSYDLHPVVRGYAFDVLEQTERAEISNLIVDHFQSKPRDLYAGARTLADVHQSIRIFRALVQAGRFDKAISFYKNDFGKALVFSVGAPHENLALIKPFFPDGFGKPAAVLTSQDDQAYLLASAGIALQELNLLADAREAQTAGLHIHLVATRNPAGVDTHLSGLAGVSFDEGRMYSATAMNRLALDLAQAVEDEERIAVRQLGMMRLYYLTGLFEQAEAAYNAFQQLPTPTDYAMYRPGDAEAALCWLRLYQGVLTDVQIGEAETIAQAGSRRTRTLLVRLRGELALQRGDTSLAIAMFERAIEMQQAVGLPVASLEALLARAKVIAGDHEQARIICDRLHELARPPHVELASAYLEIGESEKALLHALAGYSWAWADGPPYSRWYELEQCRAVLRRLGQPEPALRGFDPNAIEPLPYEDEIRQLIAELEEQKKARLS